MSFALGDKKKWREGDYPQKIMKINFIILIFIYLTCYFKIILFTKKIHA